MSWSATTIEKGDVRAGIEGDVLCVTCGGSIRSLSATQVCPACATPVHRSLHCELLRYADPAWLRRIRRGILLTEWYLLISILVFAAAFLVRAWGWSGLLDTLFTSITAGLGLWAALLVTAREPRGRLEDPTTARVAIRICALGALIGAICSIVGELVLSGWTLILCGVAGLAAALVVTFGEFAYFRDFARRIPDNKLVRSTTGVMWGLVIAGTATGAATAIKAIHGSPDQNPLVAGIFAMLSALGGVGFVAFGIAAVILLFWLNSALKYACEQSLRLAKSGGPAWTATRHARTQPIAVRDSSGGLGLPLMQAPSIVMTPGQTAPRPRGDDLVPRLTTALWREPRSPQVHFDLAVALASRGRLREAIQQYQEAIRIRPDYAEAHLNLANCLVRHRQSGEAIVHLKRVLEHRPDLPTAHYNLANILFRQGRLGEAIQHYAAATRVQPDFVRARHNLAVALLRQGKDAEAIVELRAVLELDSDNSKARHELEAALARGNGLEPVH
ncbi:MAG TPA: tetratricopeptide repeat protein [Phycisphaerae bacterium]|nr:tetratricopeptide repeat protein [Phycisphaerae bacterium]